MDFLVTDIVTGETQHLFLIIWKEGGTYLVTVNTIKPKLGLVFFYNLRKCKQLL